MDTYYERHRHERRAYYKANRAKRLAYARELRTANLLVRPWKALVKNAEHRALNSGLPFDLTEMWGADNWTGKCAVTGLLFRPGRGAMNPFSPSIDRIVPEKGYVQSNCRFVLMIVNTIKGTGSDAEMLQVVRAIAASNNLRP